MRMLLSKPELTKTGASLVTAALKIATVNHYMVGFDAQWTETISLEDFRDAYRHLRTEGDLRRNGYVHVPSPRAYQRALEVLATLCLRQHGRHPY